LDSAFFLRKALSATQKSGNDGEALAAKFLRKPKDFRSWRAIGETRKTCEMSSTWLSRSRHPGFRRSENARCGCSGAGYYAVNKKKKKVLLRACGAYMHRLRAAHRPTSFRFDVVEVSTTAGIESEVRHFETCRSSEGVVGTQTVLPRRHGAHGERPDGNGEG